MISKPLYLARAGVPHLAAVGLPGREYGSSAPPWAVFVVPSLVHCLLGTAGDGRFDVGPGERRDLGLAVDPHRDLAGGERRRRLSQAGENPWSRASVSSRTAST